MNDHQKNRVRLKAVHRAFAGLQDKVVFVGGSTVSLYADVPTLNIRPTDDVDVIIEVLNYGNRAELEEKLRSFGFQHDVASGIICRYRIQGVIVDIMPTTPESIGFSNKWYPRGFANAIDHVLDDVTIKILSAPYFIATKLEAFKGRGGDGRTSHDFEDIVYVIENRASIWQELSAAGDEVKSYLLEEFKKLRANPYITEWIDCHVVYTSPPSTYYIMEGIDSFIA